MKTEEIRNLSKEIYQVNCDDYVFTNSDEAFHRGIKLGVEYTQSIIKENYVEKEFALWLAVKSYEAFEQNEDNYTVWWVKDGFQYNLDELHQYWLENIKDK